MVTFDAAPESRFWPPDRLLSSSYSSSSFRLRPDVASKMWTGILAFVPKGLKEGSQPRKLSGLEGVQERNRPVGKGMIGSKGAFYHPGPQSRGQPARRSLAACPT